MPLKRRDGSCFGTLCALDPLPSNLTEDDLAIFHLLANLIGFELEADEIQRLRETQLKEFERIGKLREQLMGVLGHDLRTPLNTITMAADLLSMSDELAGNQGRLVGMITSNAGRMERMIGDMLDFTRSRLGEGIPIAPTAMDMHTICRQVVESLRIASPTRLITLSVAGDGRGEWDPDRVAQVLTNLVSNALQYSPTEAPVAVSARDDNSAVILEVKNEGPPIPAEALAEIFSPFRRGVQDKGGNLPTSGLGLGLYIVAQIMQAHRGSVEVQSTSTEGTTFTAYWPRQQTQSLVAAAASSAHHDGHDQFEN